MNNIDLRNKKESRLPLEPLSSWDSKVSSPSDSKSKLYRSYTVHQLVTPTKSGGRAHLTLEELAVGVRYSDEEPFLAVGNLTPAARVSRASLRISPGDNDSLKQKGGNLPLHDHGTFSNLNLPRETHVKRTPDGTRFLREQSAKRRKYTDKSVDTSGRKEWPPENPKIKDKSYSWKDILFLHISLATLLGAVLYYLCINSSSQTHLDFSNIRLTLSVKVFGQENAVKLLIDSIEELSLLKSHSLSPVIIVSGGIGVGKTFSMSIIANSFPSPGRSIFLVLPPLLPHESILKQLTNSGPNLLVIDDLNIQSSISIFTWAKELFEKAAEHQMQLIIALIFNVQVWDSAPTLLNDHSFNKILEDRGKALVSGSESYGFYTQHVHFPPLPEHSVRQCIVSALRERGIKSTYYSDYVTEISRLSEDKHQGCKRVWSRVLALNISSET